LTPQGVPKLRVWLHEITRLNAECLSELTHGARLRIVETGLDARDSHTAKAGFDGQLLLGKCGALTRPHRAAFIAMLRARYFLTVLWVVLPNVSRSKDASVTRAWLPNIA
jgi:hypothetical protein